MSNFLYVVGGILFLCGLLGVFAQKWPTGKSYFDGKFGEGWEQKVVGLWFGWRMLAFGAFILYFDFALAGGKRLFNSECILGTFAIASSLIVIFLKNVSFGQEMLRSKFGENWRKHIIVTSLGKWNFIAGLFMWLPDRYTWDIVAWVIFIAVGFFSNLLFGNKDAGTRSEAV